MEWLNLVGFPGETQENYDRIAALMPRLVHLQPPGGFYPARADRFSPFQRDPGSFGVTLDPLPAYAFTIPHDEESRRRLAYHFVMRSDALDQVPSYTASAESAYRAWKRHHSESALWMTREGDGVVVHDERYGFAHRRIELTGADAAIMQLCWQVTSMRSVRELVGDRFSKAELEEAVVRLDDLALVMIEAGNIVSLALRQPGFKRAPAWAELREGAIRPFGDLPEMDQGAPVSRLPARLN
jgi:hypothetical protein